MKGVSFKKEKRETGLRAVGSPYPWVTIKYNRKPVGSIIPSSWSRSGWSFQIKAKDGDGWQWVMSKNAFVSEDAAREAASEFVRKLVEAGKLFEGAD